MERAFDEAVAVVRSKEARDDHCGRGAARVEGGGGGADDAAAAGSADGGAEPCGQVGQQVLLVIARPCHVTVRVQGYCGYVQFLDGVDDVVDPIFPVRHRQPAAHSTAPVSSNSTSRRAVRQA